MGAALLEVGSSKIHVNNDYTSWRDSISFCNWKTCQLLGLPNILPIWLRELFPWRQSGRALKLTTYLYRDKNAGAVPILFHMFSRRGAYLIQDRDNFNRKKS
jgi:hypothetical protein